MKKTSKVILALLPFIVLPCIIGTGFAIFNFGGTVSKSSTSVNIDIENGTNVGTARLVFKSFNDDGTDTSYVLEANNSSLSVKPVTCLFCDTDSVYFTQNYRLYEERSFTLDFTKEENNDIWNNYIVSLACTMTFEDSNERGVEFNNNKSSSGTIQNYPTSDSLLDIVEPTQIEFEDTSYNLGSDTDGTSTNTNKYISKFNATNYNNGSVDDATFITYSAVVCSDLSSLTSTNGLIDYSFKMKLEYKTAVDKNSDETSTTYSFRPSDYRSSKQDGVNSRRQQVILGIYDALTNSVVDIFFTLHLTPKTSN